MKNSEAARSVVENKQCVEIDGVLLDSVTAAAMVAVYDKLNEASRAKFDALTLVQCADVCWKLIEKGRAA